MGEAVLTPRCAFGTPWQQCAPCAACGREADRLEAAFWSSVFFGEYNRLGYTEAEWVRSGRPRETWRDAA